MTVQSRAVAGAIPFADGCVIALDPDDRGALRVDGSSNLSSDCGIFVNSTHDQALILNGTGVCIDGGDEGIFVSGGVFAPSNPACVSPEPVQAPPILNPLAYLTEPAAGGCDFMNTQVTGGTVTLSPGRYCTTPTVSAVTDPDTGITTIEIIYHESIRISNGTVTFNPGTYILDSGMRITGGTVSGTGVTFFSTNISGAGILDAWKSFWITGNPIVNFSAPTTGDYAGVLFWEADDAPTFDSDGEKRVHLFAGNASSTLEGTIYIPNSEVRWEGTGTTAEWTQIISNTIRVGGNAVVPSAKLNDSSIPVPTRKVTLVERGRRRARGLFKKQFYQTWRKTDANTST